MRCYLERQALAMWPVLPHVLHTVSLCGQSLRRWAAELQPAHFTVGDASTLVITDLHATLMCPVLLHCLQTESLCGQSFFACLVELQPEHFLEAPGDAWGVTWTFVWTFDAAERHAELIWPTLPHVLQTLSLCGQSFFACADDPQAVQAEPLYGAGRLLFLEVSFPAFPAFAPFPPTFPAAAAGLESFAAAAAAFLAWIISSSDISRPKIERERVVKYNHMER